MKLLNKNKRGQIGPGFILALFLAVVLFLFLIGGGAGTILSISNFLKQIPTFVWVILIAIFIFRGLEGKRKR